MIDELWKKWAACVSVGDFAGAISYANKIDEIQLSELKLKSGSGS